MESVLRASASLASLQAQVKAETNAALQGRLRLDLDAHIATPVLVLPESLLVEGARCLVVQLGDVAFRSATAEAERARRGASDAITSDAAFDTWTLAVLNVGASIQPGFDMVGSRRAGSLSAREEEAASVAECTPAQRPLMG